jgi:hypothetical protein
MVDLLFILHIITAVVLLLVTVTYLVEFSYRHKNYPKIKDQGSIHPLNGPEYEYKNLITGKAANGAYYAGCQRWLIKKFISLVDNDNAKKVYEDEYKKIKDDDFIPVDPIGHPERISFMPVIQFPQPPLYSSIGFPNSNSGDKSYKFAYCTNE